jgi:hypothetical protein
MSKNQKMLKRSKSVKDGQRSPKMGQREIKNEKTIKVEKAKKC